MQQLEPNLPYTELVQHLNLKDDDCVLIASDITKLALQARKNGQQFSVDAFISAFQQQLIHGTLLIPAFTDNLKDGGTFDHKKSKPTTGALSNKISRNKQFKRTLDPIHSFYVWGKHQEFLVNLNLKSTFGPSSAFDFLHQQKAKMIFIDVDLQHSFTFVHHVEQCLNVPYRKDYKLNINYVDQAGQANPFNILFHTKKWGVYTDLSQLQAHLIANGSLKQLNFGEVNFRYIELDQAFVEVTQWLAAGKKLHGFSIKLYIKQLVKRLLGYKNPIG